MYIPALPPCIMQHDIIILQSEKDRKLHMHFVPLKKSHAHPVKPSSSAEHILIFQVIKNRAPKDLFPHFI